MDVVAVAIAKKNKPTDAQIATAVDDWLETHPEATTTVEDGAITNAKLNSSLKATTGETTAYLGIV